MPTIIKIRHLVLTFCAGLLLVLSAIVLFMLMSDNHALKAANDMAYAGIVLFLLLSVGSFVYQVRRAVFEWKGPKVSDTIDAELVETDEPILNSFRVLNTSNVAFALLCGVFFVFMVINLPLSSLLEYVVFVTVGYSAFGNMADFLDRRLWKQNEGME